MVGGSYTSANIVALCGNSYDWIAMMTRLHVKKFWTRWGWKVIRWPNPGTFASTSWLIYQCGIDVDALVNTWCCQFHGFWICLSYKMLHYWSCQIGKNKVFLRAGQMAELDARRTEVLVKAARVIQRQIRTFIARKEFLLLRKAAIYLQSRWRGIICCLLLLRCTWFIDFP